LDLSIPVAISEENAEAAFDFGRQSRLSREFNQNKLTWDACVTEVEWRGRACAATDARGEEDEEERSGGRALQKR